MTITKPYLRLNDLKKSKAKKVANFSVGKLTKIDSADLTEPGFYFFTKTQNNTVYARFFVGRQRSKTGIENVASKLRNRKTHTGEVLMELNTSFDVYFIGMEHIKHLTNGYGRGKLSAFFTLQYKHEFQNLSELNRMLNDHFKFPTQKY